jgi:hypothetical protein
MEASTSKFPDEIVEIICYKFNMNIWLSRKEAAAKISVSTETIDRRALAWQKEPMANRIRYKLLKLGDDTRKQRRYYEPDIEAMLVTR